MQKFSNQMWLGAIPPLPLSFCRHRDSRITKQVGLIEATQEPGPHSRAGDPRARLLLYGASWYLVVQGWGEGPRLRRLGKRLSSSCPPKVNLGWASKQAKRLPDATEVPPPLKLNLTAHPLTEISQEVNFWPQKVDPGQPLLPEWT